MATGTREKQSQSVPCGSGDRPAASGLPGQLRQTNPIARGRDTPSFHHSSIPSASYRAKRSQKTVVGSQWAVGGCTNEPNWGELQVGSGMIQENKADSGSGPLALRGSRAKRSNLMPRTERWQGDRAKQSQFWESLKLEVASEAECEAKATGASHFAQKRLAASLRTRLCRTKQSQSRRPPGGTRGHPVQTKPIWRGAASGKCQVSSEPRPAGGPPGLATSDFTLQTPECAKQSQSVVGGRWSVVRNKPNWARRAGIQGRGFPEPLPVRPCSGQALHGAASGRNQNQLSAEMSLRAERGNLPIYADSQKEGKKGKERQRSVGTHPFWLSPFSCLPSSLLESAEICVAPSCAGARCLRLL